MSNWHDAADAKLQIHDFWKSPHGARVAKGFAEAIREGNPNPNPLYQSLHKLEEVIMSRAEPIWVSPDIMDIVEVAQESFLPEAFVESDLLTTSGFILLPRAVLIPDAMGKTVSFRAFSWYPTVGPPPGEHIDPEERVQGVWMSFYSHIDDLSDETQGDRLSSLVVKEQKDYGYSCPWVFLHGMLVPFGMTPNEWTDNAVRKPGYTDDKMQSANDGWWRFVQTLMRLSMQHLSQRTGMPYPRHVRRRMKRSKIDLDPDDMITVITLRKPRAPKQDGEGEPVNWTHRWIVNAFWRNQWYPSLGMHRQIYISEYVKGPEHLPLAVRKGRAWNFVR